MRRRRAHFVWLVALLVLAALAALWWPAAEERDPWALLRRMCRHLDGLREIDVAVTGRWEHGGRPGREKKWTLRFSEDPPLLDARSGPRGRVALTREGVLVQDGCTSRTEPWPGSPPPSVREAAGALLGVPRTSDEGHPALKQGMVPYALGPLVHTDSFSFYAEGVTGAAWLGLSDGVHHLGFHQEGMDWQIWLDEGPRPLPRRVRLEWVDLADGRPGRALDLRYDWH